MIRQDLRQLRESLGPRGFYDTLASLLHSGELAPDDFSLRQLWEACVGPAHLTLPTHRARRGTYLTDLDQLQHLHSEADLGTHLFQTVTGALLSKTVLDSYHQADGLIGDDLVTVERSAVRGERVPGFTALQGPREVLEGMPYEEASFGDKFVTTTEAKKGRLLSITEEAVFFDQTGALLRRAARIGEATRLEREKTIVRGVIDADFDEPAGTGVYRPSGQLTELFPADGSLHNCIGTGNTVSGDFAMTLPLEDWTAIATVLRFHATQVRDDRHAPEEGEPIVWMPKVLLVPKNLELAALQIVTATTVHVHTGSGSRQTEFKNPCGGAYFVRSSPFLDAVDPQTWYLGDFKRQYLWKEIWPIQVFRQMAPSEDSFDRDVVARFKVRYYGGINALDHRFVIKAEGE
ncbi:MAG TPA: hypothetical protein PKC45_02365 [Gemmatales bacterium]|nr:hypothetical protein [Gemmatales bacterium]